MSLNYPDTELIKNVYKRSFAVEKLRADLLAYLKEASEHNEVKKLSDKEYVLDVFNQIANEIECITI